MYKILWIAPNSLHDLTSPAALQVRSFIDFFTQLGLQVTVVSLAIFSKFHKDCIDPILFQAGHGKTNSFMQEGVEYVYSSAKTSLDKLAVIEQRAYFNLFEATLRRVKPDAVFCADADILSRTLLLEAHNCKIPTVFVLHKPLYADFDFSMVDLTLSTDPSLSLRYVEKHGRQAVEIGPWCFDPLKDQASVDKSTDYYRHYGPWLRALLKLNQQALEHKISGVDYKEQLASLSAELQLQSVDKHAVDQDAEGFTHEILIPHVELAYALNQVISLVLHAPQQESLRGVRFIFNERHLERLQTTYNQIMAYTSKELQKQPELVKLDPHLEQLCHISYEDFIKLPHVKITYGQEQLIKDLQHIDLCLDLSLVEQPIDFIVSQALSYGVPVITSTQKQLPCELNAALGILTLAPSTCENPLLLTLTQDISPLIELVKAFLCTDKHKLQENCFKALQETQSLEQALRCYYAVLPYLKRKASQDPHVMLRSMVDLKAVNN